jgi:hypothetical protein
MKNMTKMSKIVEDLMALPYYKNHAASSGKVHNIAKHEDAVEDVLLSHGMTKSKITKVPKKERDEWLADGDSCQSLNEGEYISQPCGKQSNPDFILKIDGRVYFLECKSVTKGGSPMYNSAIPKGNYIYVFCSKKYDKTTVYLGEDVCPPEQQKLFEEHAEQAKNNDAKLNQKLRESGQNTHGIEFYTRAMYTHAGDVAMGGPQTDYFLNENRERNEENVMRFVNG